MTICVHTSSIVGFTKVFCASTLLLCMASRRLCCWKGLLLKDAYIYSEHEPFLCRKYLHEFLSFVDLYKPKLRIYFFFFMHINTVQCKSHSCHLRWPTGTKMYMNCRLWNVLYIKGWGGKAFVEVLEITRKGYLLCSVYCAQHGVG